MMHFIEDLEELGDLGESRLSITWAGKQLGDWGRGWCAILGIHRGNILEESHDFSLSLCFVPPPPFPLNCHRTCPAFL
jgi:hypothetical protein